MPPARTLLVPMKDEAARLGASLAAIRDSALHDPDTELVLVDDGSTDGTAGAAEALVRRLGLHGTVVRLPRNLGKGAALEAGVRAARGATIAFVDADLSTPPDAVVACFELVEAGKADVVVTTRVHPEAVIGRMPPTTRRYGGKAFNTLLRGLGLTRLRDTQCGLKAFTAEAAAVLFDRLRIRGFAFDVEVLLRAERAGFTVVELPVEWHHVEASRVRTFRDGSRMAWDAVRLRLGGAAWRPPSTAPTAMDVERFELMAELEQDHWWFAAKRRLVLAALRAHPPAAPGATVDVGCGTGAMAAELARAGHRPVLGTDPSGVALALAAAASPAVAPDVALVAAAAERLAVRDGAAACITSLDVLEHLDDDVAALREYARVLAPGGTLVLTVPAYRWAWSDHDTALGHRRRYTATRLRDAVVAAGLSVERVTYVHAPLVPAAALLRRTPLRHLVRGSQEEVSRVGPALNRALGAVCDAERAVALRVGVPVGLSVLLVARR